MEFSVSSSALSKQLSNLSGVLGSSNALPILDNFLFTLNKSELKLSASDLETTVVTSLQVESENSGSIAIPAKLLLEMLKAMPEQPITFSVDKKKFSVTVSSDFGAYKLAGHDPEDFPKIQELDSPSSVEVDAAVLSKSISKTIFAAGDDELRPAMCGVYFQLDKDSATFVATDAHKLVRYKRNDIKSDKATSFIVPKKPLSLLRSILNDGKVTVSYNNTNVSFNCGTTQIISRLIDAKYPNYDAVIPKENPNVLTIDRSLFANSIRRIAIFANKTSSQIKLNLKGTELILSAEDIDYSNEATEKLKCNYKGDDIQIGFNAKILAEVVGSIDGEEITLEMSSANKAGIIKPVSVSKDEDILMLVMPSMINQ